MNEQALSFRNEQALSFRNSRGVTYLELLLVVAIMLTLSVLSASFYARFINQNDVANVVDQFAGSFRKAQIYAMMGKQSGSHWGVNYSSNTITLFKGNSFALRDQAFDEKFSVNPNITISGFSELYFNHATGLPSATPTITITSPGNNSKTITINLQGVVNK